MKLKSIEDTHLVYKYVTRVPLHDKNYTSRLQFPAKKYRFDFAINDSDEHLIFSQAFGFKDDASNTKPIPAKNTVHYEFENWLFERDGVAISFE